MLQTNDDFANIAGIVEPMGLISSGSIKALYIDTNAYGHHEIR